MSLLLLVLVTLYLISVSLTDPEESKSDVICQLNAFLYEGVVQHSDKSGTIDWSNKKLASENYEIFAKENSQRLETVGPLVEITENFGSTLLQVNASLEQKTVSLYEKTFKMPTLNGTRDVILPIYWAINTTNQQAETYLFYSTV